jgi:hypothetical protein
MRGQNTRPQLDNSTEAGQGEGFVFCSKVSFLIFREIYFNFLKLWTIRAGSGNFRQLRIIIARLLRVSSGFSGPRGAIKCIKPLRRVFKRGLVGSQRF